MTVRDCNAENTNMLLKHDGQYYVPPSTPFITYEDSDIGSVIPLGGAHIAGRGEGRTERDLHDFKQKLDRPGSHLFVAANSHEAEHLCQRFRQTYRHIQRGRYLTVHADVSIGLFRSISASVRGLRYTSVTFDHRVIEEANRHRSVCTQQRLNRYIAELLAGRCKP